MAVKDLVSIHHLSYDLTVDYLRRITDLGDAFELRDMPRPGVLDSLETFASSLCPEAVQQQSTSSTVRRSLYNVPGQHTKKSLVRTVYSESLAALPKPTKTSRPNSAAPNTPILALTTDRAPVKPLTIAQPSGCGSTALIYYYFCCCFQGTISPGGIFPSLVEDGDWLVTRSFVALIPRNENTRARVIAAKRGGTTTTIPHPMNYIRFVDLGAFSDLEKLRQEWLVDHDWVACGSHAQAADLARQDWPILIMPSWSTLELKLAAFWCHPKLAKREIKHLEARAYSHGLQLKELFAPPPENNDDLLSPITALDPPEDLKQFCSRLSRFMALSLISNSQNCTQMQPLPRAKLHLAPAWRSAELEAVGLRWLQHINATEEELWKCALNDQAETPTATGPGNVTEPECDDKVPADSSMDEECIIPPAQPGSSHQPTLSVSLEEAISEEGVDVETAPALEDASVKFRDDDPEGPSKTEQHLEVRFEQPNLEADTLCDDPTIPVGDSASDCLISNAIPDEVIALVGPTPLCPMGRLMITEPTSAPSPPPLQQSPILNHLRPQTTLTPIAEERSEISLPCGEGELTPKFSSRISAQQESEEMMSVHHQSATTPGVLEKFNASVRLPPSKTSVAAIEAPPAVETSVEEMALEDADPIAALADLPAGEQMNTCLVLSRPGSPSRASSPRSYSCAVIIDSDYEIGPVILSDERKTPARLSVGRQQPCEIMDDTGRGRSIVQSMVKCWEMSMSPDASMAPSGARQSAIRARVEQKRRAAVRDSARRGLPYETDELCTDVIGELTDGDDDYLHQICLEPCQSKKRRYSADQSMLVYPHSAPLLMSDTINQDGPNPGISMEHGVDDEDVDTLERDIQLLRHQMNMAARQWRMCEAALGTMTTRLQEQKALKGPNLR